jgi:putative NADH-flavin reductase
MKLLIFGPTGGTGAHLLAQALEAGHDVTVVARHPERIPAPSHAQPTVITGDALDPQTWKDKVAGHDAILSCLGSRDRKNPTTVYSQGTANIIEAMRPAGVRRLICLSSAGLDIPADTPLLQRLVTRHVIQRLYRHGYTDMRIMESLVALSDTDWTIVRPPMLTNGPLTRHYRTATGQHLTQPKSIPRADLAHYLLHHIEDQDTWRHRIEISR